MAGPLDEPIEVRTYAGGRGGEVPRAVRLRGAWVPVDRVLGRWIEEQVDPARGRRFWFRVQVEGDETCELYYEDVLDTWFLVPRKTY